MRLTVRLLVLVLLAVCMLGGVGHAAQEKAAEFVVASFSPEGEVKGSPKVTAVFSAPVVQKTAVGKPLDEKNAPFLLLPRLKGGWTWKDERTCVFTPAVPFALATRYTATFRDDLRDQNGRLLAGRHVFAFRTAPLAFLDATQVNFDPRGSLTLDLRFSLPVSPLRLRGYLAFRDEGGRDIPYDLPAAPPAKKVSVRLSSFSGKKLTLEIAAGFPPATGDLGLAKDVRQEIVPAFVLAIQSGYAESEAEDRGRIWVSTSAPVDVGRAASFVSLSPAVPFTVEPSDWGFAVVGDFRPRDRVVLTVQKGLPGAQGGRLEAEYQKAFIFPDVAPLVRFPAAGTYISPAGDLRIPLETVNVDEVEITAWRVYDNNVPLAMGLGEEGLSQSLSRLVARENFLPGGGVNELTRRAVDLRSLVSPDKGIFLLTAQDMQWGAWEQGRLVVSVSDLGVTAKVFPRGVLVWVNSIASLAPVGKAVVRVYSASNQLLAEGSTDGDGVALVETDAPWDEQLFPRVVTVSSGEDATYLVLRQDLVALAGYETAGRPYLRKGYDAFLFLPRGVFRPGETADVTALLRDPEHRPPESFPLQFSVMSPTGRELLRESALLTPQGFAHVAIPLADSVPTGTYTVRIFLPGEKTPLESLQFLVEEFAPPRIEVEAEADRKELFPGDSLEFAVTGRYLFGAPAAGLPCEVEVRLVPRPFAPPGWEGFVFADGEKKPVPYQEFLGSIVLDDEGKGRFTYEGPFADSGTLLFRAGVMEEGGRFAYKTLSLPYHPVGTYLGIRALRNEVRTGASVSFSIGAALPDGSPASLDAATAEISRVIWHSVLVEEDGRYRFQGREEFVSLERSGVPLSGGEGSFAFTPREDGQYLLRVTDEEGGAAASVRFYAFGDGGAGGGSLLDQVRLSPSKTLYAEGDEARIKVEAPFAGKLLFTVETDRVLERRVLDLATKETEIRFPVTAAMAPNAYCTVWVVREVSETVENWGSHRALGTVRIAVDQDVLRLRTLVEAPSRVRPGRSFSVSVRLEDTQGNAVPGEAALAFVDEGILGLTDFTTPDPWSFFTALRALGVQTFDLYDDLLPVEGKGTALLRPGGGDGEEAMMRASLSPVRARRFVPLSFFLPPQATDAEGRVTMELDIPEFSGRGRVMVVAAAGALSGMGEVPVEIARDVVAELSLPRAVAPGDTFLVPVTLFSKAERSLDVRVELRLEGPISSDATLSSAHSLDPGGKSEALLVPLRAVSEGGVARVTVAASWDGDLAEETISLPIRPASPRISLSGGGSVPAGSVGSLELPRSWFPGTVRSRLVLSGAPGVDLAGVLRYLDTYPYGCLEQTVSSAWPLLALPSIVAEVDPLLANEAERRRLLDERVRRIMSLQRWDGGFSLWPGSAEGTDWSGVYAVHFLVAAKKQGVPLSEESLGFALSFVRRLLPALPGGTDEDVLNAYTAKAYGAYVLALAGEPPLAWMEHLRERTEQLRAAGRLFLAGAYALSGQKETARNLLGQTAVSVETPPSGTETLDSGVRDSALALLMWLQIDTTAPEIPLLAEKLLAARTGGTWYGTQENAFAVLALGAYLDGTGRARRPFTARLQNEEGRLLGEVRQGERLVLSEEDGLDLPLRLSCSGEGTVYYAWVVDGVPLEMPKPVSQGISIKRTFLDRSGTPLAKDAEIRQGDLLQVQLEILPERTVTDLVVADLLPGCFEIENPRLTADAEGEQDARVREEVRDDRLLLFVNRLAEKKAFRYVYQVRAVSRGGFVLPPAAVEAMYDPAVRAIGPAGMVRVE